jgi:DNA polymerase-3 subunit delta'
MPTVAPWRIVVFEDADRFNDSSANALLKSIEEPPERTVFILCAPEHGPGGHRGDAAVAGVGTSMSRHPSRAEVGAVLLGDARLGLSEEQASWAADVAGGHIGRARHLASEEKARAKSANALKLPGLVYEGAAAYQFIVRAGEVGDGGGGVLGG